MSAKRILIVTSELVPFHYGGIGTQFKSLVAFLKRHGHHVSLLAGKPKNYDAHIYRSHYGETPIFFVDTPLAQTGPPQHFVYAAEVGRRFAEIYPDNQPDLVIVADYNAEGFFLLLQSEAGVYNDTEFLLTINGMNREVISVHEGERQGTLCSSMEIPEIRSLLAMEDICVHLARRIVSPTVCAWKEIRQRLDTRKIARIIPNLVDPTLFHPEKTGMREEPQESLILFVGRLDRMKGADLLLKAFLEIADQVNPILPRIIFIGRDCYWHEYGSTFLEYWQRRIPERYTGAISFLGQVSHESLSGYLKKASMAVFPSRWEPFGIVCLEALSMGCPVIVSQGTGFEEVLGPAFSEFAVPVTEDIRPLKQKILDLMRKKDTQSMTEKLRGRAREVVHQAETGWLDLLRDLDRKNQIEGSAAASVIAPLLRLLSSLDDQWCGVSFLQVYFCRQGQYAEADSWRVPYARHRWITLKIPLPSGTGDKNLRLDPADRAGVIRIREIALIDDRNGEIWRADGGNGFQGCRVVGEATGTVCDRCLILTAPTADPQILLDCPATDRSAEMRVILFAGDN